MGTPIRGVPRCFAPRNAIVGTAFNFVREVRRRSIVPEKSTIEINQFFPLDSW
jgi:hypothetical protein